MFSISPGRLDNLDDANGNGFADVKAPRGISFDYESNLNVRFTNEISVSDLAQLVSGYNIDTSLLNLVEPDGNGRRSGCITLGTLRMS